MIAPSAPPDGGAAGAIRASIFLGCHHVRTHRPLVLIAIGSYGIRQSTDTPLDRVDQSLWPYLHH